MSLKIVDGAKNKTSREAPGLRFVWISGSLCVDYSIQQQGDPIFGLRRRTADWGRCRENVISRWRGFSSRNRGISVVRQRLSKVFVSIFMAGVQHVNFSLNWNITEDGFRECFSSFFIWTEFDASSVWLQHCRLVVVIFEQCRIWSESIQFQ